MRSGGDRDELAEVGLAGVAAEVLESRCGSALERERRAAAIAVEAARGPELAVAGEADRVRSLAVEGRPQRLSEAGSAEGQVEGGEVLQGEIPIAGRQAQRLRAALAGAENAAVLPSRFGPDHRVGEEPGAAAAGEEDADLRRRAVGAGAGLGALEQDVTVRRRRARPFPEDEGRGRGDATEIRGLLAVPGGVAGDDVP